MNVTCARPSVAPIVAWACLPPAATGTTRIWGRTTYRVFTAAFIACCAVVFANNRLVFDRDMPAWLLISLIAVVVADLALDAPYQRRKIERESRV